MVQESANLLGRRQLFAAILLNYVSNREKWKKCAKTLKREVQDFSKKFSEV